MQENVEQMAEDALQAAEAVKSDIKMKKEIRVQAFLSYPEIIIEQRNHDYALAMLDNVGGVNSEMSAINSYVYNQMMAADFDDIAYVFHRIGIVEMHHLNLFGKLALCLGAEPRLWTRQKNRMKYWTPAYGRYTENISGMLLNAIEDEHAAIAKYRRQQHVIDNHCIQEILKHIIEDEKLHVEILTDLYEQYQCGRCRHNG